MQLRSIILTVIAAGGAWAWQDSLGQLALTRETFERLITNYVFSSGSAGDLSSRLPGMGRAGTQALMAMSDPARAAVVKELGLAAKSLVMSPAFAAAYEQHLKTTYNAVNHGITVNDTNAAMERAAKSGNMDAYQNEAENMMRNGFRQQVAQRAKEFDRMQREQIEIVADVEAGVIETMAAPRTASEKANVAKAKTMLAEAKKLASTDLDKARSTYKAAMMLAAGLSDDSQAASTVEQQKKQEQQANYNRLMLKKVLKERLQQFVAVAKTVDFNAATQKKGDKIVFVSPAYERKNELWKMLFRLGPGGTNAALAVAQAWLAEL